MCIPFLRSWRDGRRAPSWTRPGPQELPPAPRGTHYHVCTVKSCRNHIVCSRGPECPVAAWECPACEADALDRWMLEEETRTRP